MSGFYRYIRSGKDRLSGWFGRVDSQIFFELLSWQNSRSLPGAVAEIGVHHGKCFIALCLALTGDQKAYAIDLFDDQSANLDHSGRGDRGIFEQNLIRHGIPADRVLIDARSSERVTAEDILEKTGPVRFFSVDGGHWRDIVLNDLKLAQAVMSEDGIIAVDDFMRPQWPDVTVALIDWLENSAGDFVPFAIGYNKLYLCRRSRSADYQSCLEKSEFLRYFLTKHYDFYGHSIPVYQSYLLPEWGLLRQGFEYLKLYHPDFYVTLRRLLPQSSGRPA